MDNLIVASSVLRCREIDSTNALLRDLLRESDLPEGYTVTSQYQRLGRGQPGTQWEAAPGKNLLMSVLLKPHFLAADQAFYLNMSVCLALHDCLTHAGLAVKLKWPNDLWDAQGFKYAGILIENQLKSRRIETAIIGLGLNVNQRTFQVSQAGSMALATGQEWNLEQVEAQCCRHLDRRYKELHQPENWPSLRQEYLEKLYGHNQAVPAQEASHRGTFTIKGLGENGRLQGAWEDGRLAEYAFKEIQFLPPTTS